MHVLSLSFRPLLLLCCLNKSLKITFVSPGGCLRCGCAHLGGIYSVSKVVCQSFCVAGRAQSPDPSISLPCGRGDLSAFDCCFCPRARWHVGCLIVPMSPSHISTGQPRFNIDIALHRIMQRRLPTESQGLHVIHIIHITLTSMQKMFATGSSQLRSKNIDRVKSCYSPWTVQRMSFSMA